MCPIWKMSNESEKEYFCIAMKNIIDKSARLRYYISSKNYRTIMYFVCQLHTFLIPEQPKTFNFEDIFFANLQIFQEIPQL